MLRDLGRLAEAEASYLRALEIRPDYPEAHSNRGATLKDLGRLAEAEASYRKALEIKPEYPEAYNNLGNTLQEQGRLAEAEASYRRGLELKPEYVEALSNLGVTLKDLGRFAEAETHFRKALEIRQDYAEAYNNLGITLKDLGRFAEAEESYRRALELKPDFVAAHNNLLFSMCYHPIRNALEIHKEACTYGEVVGNMATRRFSGWHCTTAPERLRVGLVSGDLRAHPVGFFLEGLLSKIDRASIELIAYPTFHKATGLTTRLKKHFSAWKPLVGLSDEAAAALIHRDSVHILIDLSGHTAHNRLPVFAWKPAPIQVTWLGYWATTGVKEIDYVLVDKTGVPTGRESAFSEQPWYLPQTRLCFTPPDEAPQVAALPALGASGREVTFGCFQTLPKVNDETLSVWGRVLAMLPGSRLRWQCSQFDDRAVADATLERLSGLGIEPSRVRLPGRMPRARYLASYAEVDAVLDTFPFPGGTTTCEALWMGVPTLTLAGESMLSRQGASLLNAAGLPEWIAVSEDDFVAKAGTLLGSDEALARLARLRAGLRPRVATSALFDAERFARQLENALWGMWDRRQADRIPGATSPPGTDVSDAEPKELTTRITVDGIRQKSARTFLHVGCGPRQKNRSTSVFDRKDWQELRLDVDPAVKPDVVGTLLDMSAIADCSVDAVFSGHNLVHLYPHEVALALAEFRRVLKPDGFVIVTCPDLQAVCALVAEDKLNDQAYLSPTGPIAPLDLIYGHRPSLARNKLVTAHRCGFTKKTLTVALQAAGFSSVAIMKRGHPFYDLWALAMVGRADEPDLRKLATDHFPK